MPRDDTRPTGHRAIDSAALNGEVRRPGQTVRDKDLIAVGRGLRCTGRELMSDLGRACAAHGAETMSKALCVESKTAMRFMAWLQAREHAGDCEVAEASALPRGEHGGDGGVGIPVPNSALVGKAVDDMLEAIMRNPRVLEEFSEWLTFTRGGV
jgi:hypothetical protein